MNEIHGLYITLYGLPATQAGLDYWFAQLENHHTVLNLPAPTLDTPIDLDDQIWLGQQMTANSPQVGTPPKSYFETLYPSTLSDNVFAEQLYQNMAGFEGTAGGIKFWVDQIEAEKAKPENQRTQQHPAGA